MCIAYDMESFIVKGVRLWEPHPNELLRLRIVQL